MSDYNKQLEQEQQYLKSVTHFLNEQIHIGGKAAAEQKENLVALRKEMFEGGMPAVDDYDRNIELSQYHTMERIETSHYEHKLSKVEKYKRILDKPYFGRFDFKEEDEDTEKVYIGYQNVMNDNTYEVMVYDWRAPIASMFYRSELGAASYKAPCGDINGEVSLKRQYEIEKGELKYFFDCALTITDEMLQQALGNNASSHMKNIVETIQKEQDLIIRDVDNDLLIVQGVAGSGKTSIAMHRIAFLLYERMNEGLTSENVMIISPNHLFGEYVSTVLPELGENNVCYSTMEDFFDMYFKNSIRLRSRSSQLEFMITHKNRYHIRKNISFKGSSTFISLLDRLVDAYENELITFRDVKYAGELIAKGEDLRKNFLDNPIQMAIGKRLGRIEHGLIKKLNELEKAKRKEMMNELRKKGGYDYKEEEQLNNTLSNYRQETLEAMRSFTKVNVFKLYEQLFKDKTLWNRFVEGLNMPKNMENIRSFTAKSLRPDLANYEDGMALLYLKLRIEDQHHYPQIRQLLIDEAQDYYPLQYKVLGEIFKNAQYTVLGDIGQTIEKSETEDLYDEVIRILAPKKALKLSLNKSYRSSYEISQFTKKLRDTQNMSIAFERHDEVPIVAQQENMGQMFDWIEDKVKEYEKNGYETIAIICKSQKEVNHVYSKLAKKSSFANSIQKKMDLKKVYSSCQYIWQKD
ncbi:RNA polymerase recycling motor HelD [Cellulosilyticum ruminicola]|uniref:RNA polymerase recycling motor HelD n=1 Tax=Cellulosilyticum ruminicola TaxID=425254 RepID=UPI0006D21319|nr:RNA polymerase recycling motor HelD [Cellulosilyticum ruminicola]